MKARLGDYIKEYTVRNKSLEDIPVYSVTNREGFCTGYFDKDVASQDRSTYKIVPKGCFAYNPSRINVGSVDWQRHLDRVIVSPLYVVFSVSPDLLPQYLFYFLKSDISLTFIRSAATGSVRDNLKFSMLQEFPIEIRTVEKQAEIIAILDKVKAICDLYQRKLDILDNLIKARFVEMFGDPITNDKGFETVLGSDVFKLSNGKFVPEDKRYDNGIPVYGGNGISWYTNDVLHETDTIVVGRVGFQSGNVHLAEGPLWISDNAMYISNIWDSGIDLRFLYHVMEHIDFTQFQDAGDLKKITQKPFMMMQYIKPPIDMQQNYIAFVSENDKSKVVVQKALDEAKLLFESLMQKYFG